MRIFLKHFFTKILCDCKCRMLSTEIITGIILFDYKMCKVSLVRGILVTSDTRN